jgi:phage terminase large subunit-like protein
MLWDEFWDCLDIATQYFENPSSFKQEFMGDVESIGVKWFKTIRTQSKKEIEEHTFTKTMLNCDPASSISVKADYTAMCVGSECDNMIYIRKGLLLKLNFNDFCKKVVEVLLMYTDITHVSIEKNLYMGADVSKIKELIDREPLLNNRYITFINKMQKTNKDEKISTIISAVNLGQICFNIEDENFINQVYEFSGQKYSLHDDAVDSVSQLVIDIKEISITYFANIIDKRLLF